MSTNPVSRFDHSQGGTPRAADRALPDQPPPDLSPIRRLIGRVRQLLRTSWVATGLGLTLALGVGFLVAVSLLDLALPLGTLWRLAGLALVIVPSLLAAYAGVLRPLFRRLSNSGVARLIESHLPGIHNRLVSVVDLDQPGAPPPMSPTFHRRLVSETLSRVAPFQAKTVVDRRSLWRSALAAVVAVAAFGGAWSLFRDRLPTTLARIFQPLADIPPASGVRYDVVPGDTAVLRGDPLDLRAEVTQGEPDRLQVEIVPTKGGPALWYDLERAADNPASWQFTLSGFDESFQYRIHGGGTWSHAHTVTMVDRPQILDARALLHLPKYLELPEPRENPPGQLAVTGPEDGQVEVQVATAGQVAQGEIQLLKTVQHREAVTERIERVWFAEAIPEGAHAEGAWEWNLRLLLRNAHTDAAQPGLHRHLFHNAPKPHVVRTGENLFAHVYIVPELVPETIMLEWHDGQNWEHRAYWGADKIAFGQPDTPSRRRLGDIPPAGEWTRLEIPADLVGLAGKSLKGMAFSLFGGQAIWHRSGTLPGEFRIVEELTIAERLPLSQLGSDVWGGRFPLVGSGKYRVELRNSLGHASQPMDEAAYVAIPDKPPQILVGRPGVDLTLSKPVRVPVAISSYDDLALAKLTLAIQPPGVTGFESRPIVRFGPGVTTDDRLYTLDLEQFGMKPGDVLKYRVEAHDRKEQSRSTQEFTIRIQNDANAADKKLEAFEKQQEQLAEKFDKLVADQQRIEDRLKDLKEKNRELSKTLDEARAEARNAADQPDDSPKPDPQNPNPQPDPKQPNPPAGAPQPKLEEATRQQVAEVQQQLAEVAQQEAQNLAAGKQLAQELKTAADQAAQLSLLPPQLQQQWQQFPESVQQEGIQPLQNLADDLQQASTPEKQPAPNVPALAEQGRQVQRNLADLQQRMKALNEATQQAQQDPQSSLDRLREKLLSQEAQTTAQDLEALQEFLKELRGDLQQYNQQEGELQTETQAAPDAALPGLEQRQDKLETRADPRLDQARQLLADPTRIPQSPPAKSAPAQSDPSDSESSQAADSQAPADQNPTGQPNGKESKAIPPDPSQRNPSQPNPTQPGKSQANKGQPEKGTSESGKPSKDQPPAGESNPAGEPPAGDTNTGNPPPAGSPQKGAPNKKGQTPPDRQALTDREAAKKAELEAAERSLAEDFQALGDLIDELQAATGEGPEGDAPPQPGEMDSSDPGDASQSPTGESAPANGKSAGRPGDMPPGSSPTPPQPGQADGQQPAEGSQPPQGASQKSSGASKPTVGEGESSKNPRPIDPQALAELLNSQRVQEAKAMAARMQAARQGADPNATAKPMTANAATPPNQAGSASATPSSLPVLPVDASLVDLDLETRTVLLKLPPRIREELLQGLREEGPEGYQQFIRNYYQRLAKVKGDKK
jgi:hypothetical protein